MVVMNELFVKVTAPNQAAARSSLAMTSNPKEVHASFGYFPDSHPKSLPIPFSLGDSGNNNKHALLVSWGKNKKYLRKKPWIVLSTQPSSKA